MKEKKVILNKIKEYETIIIHAHNRPDGDCYGAQFGLKDIIKNSFPNKKVYAVGEESDYVGFVGKIDKIPESTYEGALSIVVDTAVEDRISEPNYKLAKEIIKIDHHIPSENSYYADYYWVDTDKPSCSQMIAEFYDTFKKELKLTYAGALAMYVGIVTDTGGFRYRGVDRKTHEMAGMLLDFGVDVAEVDIKLSTKSLDEVKVKGYILMNFEQTEEGFAYFRMTKEIQEKYNLTYEEASATVSTLAGIEGYPVWALFIESDNEVRIRLRSNGPEIESVAKRYEGGGHAKAAGAKLKSYDELDAFVKDINEHLKNTKKPLWNSKVGFSNVKNYLHIKYF